MLSLDLQLSEYLFQLGRALPDFVVSFLAVVLIWLLFAFVLYRTRALTTDKEKILFLARAALAAIAALAFNALIAYFYFRLRPFAALGFDPLIVKSALEKSFPSDHAAVAGALTAVVYLYDKKSGYYAGVAALLICLGRVLAGVHYASDVISGVGLGLAIGWIVVKIFASVGGWIRGGR